jgi:hypothetical protein
MFNQPAEKDADGCGGLLQRGIGEGSKRNSLIQTELLLLTLTAAQERMHCMLGALAKFDIAICRKGFEKVSCILVTGRVADRLLNAHEHVELDL